MAYLDEVSASASLCNVVPVHVYVIIDASVYDVSKGYVSNRSGKKCVSTRSVRSMQVIVRVRSSQMDR